MPAKIVAKFSLYELLPDAPRIEVLDLGAYALAGQEPLYSDLVQAGRARVTGFEPNLSGCVELNRLYGQPHRFFPQFAGNGERAQFFETNQPYTGSLYRPNTALLEKFNDLEEVTQLVAVHDVDTVRIDSIETIDDVDFIKLDIQGGELKALEGAERALATAVMIQTEVAFVELYENQPLFADVDAYLRGRGFWFHQFLGFGSRTAKPLKMGAPDGSGGPDIGLHQQLWSDALYFRHPFRLEALTEAKLQKLAILLNDLYRSYDFAYGALAALDARRGGETASRYYERLVAG